MANILFFVPADYDSLKEKGVEKMILERSENGFFNKVITIHPYSKKTRIIEISTNNLIYEFSNDFFPFSNLLIVRILQRPFYFLRVLINSIQIAKKEQINIIRATDPYFMGLYAYCVFLFTKIPFCISIHSDYQQRYKLDKKHGSPKIFGSRFLAVLLEKFIVRRAGLLMPIRESLGIQYEKKGVKQENIRVIPHGIDLSYFRLGDESKIRDRFHIDPQKKIISFVGRVTKENYIYDIINLAQRLKKIRNDAMFILAGGGIEFENIQTLIKKEKISEFVKLLGFQDRKVAYDLRKVSDVNLCLMGGFSLIEACASGRPTVSYDVEWHSELIINLKTGILVNENDLNALEKSVNMLLDNPEKGLLLGQNAKKLAFKRHDIKNTSKVKIEAYKKILDDKSRI